MRRLNRLYLLDTSNYFKKYFISHHFLLQEWAHSDEDFDYDDDACLKNVVTTQLSYHRSLVGHH